MNLLRGAVALLTIVLAISYPTFAGKGAPSVCPGVSELADAIPKIDERGAFRGSPNYDLNESVLKLAKCYSQTSDRGAAKFVARALLRYAEVIASWPLIDQEGHPQRKIDFTAWDLGGLWGGDWVYLDLRRSANLARAFEMVSGDASIDGLSRELGMDVRTIIREKLLRYLVDYNLRFGRGKALGTNTQEAAFPFSNMDPYRLKELIVFGRVVDPGYTHVAVKVLRQFLTVGFFRDGFWHEGSISYHLQVVNGLKDIITALRGYTDPPDYNHTSYTTVFGDVYAGVPGRFDNLVPLGNLAPLFETIQSADEFFTLPDGRMVAKNDTHHTERGSPTQSPRSSTCLLGLRHCVLVQGEGPNRTLAYIGLGGTNGHEHYDALHVDLWALGRTLLSDGTYKGWSPREWNMSTAAHNTVVIDGMDQNGRFEDRVPLTRNDLIPGLGQHLWQGYGHGDSNNQGDLLGADLSGGPVQFVTADATRAYDSRIGVRRYQRTLVLVKGEKDSSYIIDVFRVIGGGHHDWMLHGDLFSHYIVQTTLKEQPDSGMIGRFLAVERTGKPAQDWGTEFVYADNKKLRTHHISTGPATLAIARGPAQVREGDAPYLVVRQAGPSSVFVNVHVPDTGKPLIKQVQSVSPSGQTEGEVRLLIKHESGRIDDTTLRLAPNDGGESPHLSHVAMGPRGIVLWRYSGDILTPTAHWRQGRIELTTGSNGDKNGFLISDWRAHCSIAPSLLHIRLPNNVVESYRIRRVEWVGRANAFVEIEGRPGVEISQASNGEAFVKQLFYPSRGLSGAIAYRTTTNDLQLGVSGALFQCE